MSATREDREPSDGQDIWRALRRDLLPLLPHDLCAVAAASADQTAALVYVAAADRSPTIAPDDLRAVCTHLVATGRPLLLADAVGAGLAARQIAAPSLAGLAWLLGAPLCAAGQALGAVVIGGTRQRPVARRDRDLLLALARQAAAALQAQRAAAAAERRRADWAALAALNRRLVASRDPDEAVHDVARAAMELLRADGSAVRLRVGDDLVLRAATGVPAPWEGAPPGLVPTRYRADDGLAARALAENRVVGSHEASSPAPARCMRPAIRAARLQSCLLAPLGQEGEALGTISVVSCTPRAYDEAEVRLLAALADQAALALRDARRYAALRRSEARYRRLAAHVLDLMLLVDDDGQITLVGGQATRLLAQPIESLLGQPVSAVLRDCRPVPDEAATPALAYETDLLRPDGSRVPVEVSVIAVREDGVRVGHQYMVRDLSARRAAEARLRLLSDAVARAADGIAIIDVDGRYLSVNAAYATMFGYTPDELVDQHVDVIRADPPGLGAASGDRWTRLNAEGHWAGPAQGRHRQGQLVSCWLSLALIRDGGGAPVALVGIVRDLTATERLEAQLAEAEKLRALGELAAGVAHNFNNVLEALLGRTDLLLAQASDAELREHLHFMRQAAEDGAAMVRRIQAFARTAPACEPVAVEVGELLRDALAMTEPRWRDAAQRHGAQIDVHVDLAAVPAVLVQPGELREVLVNLVNNAADAMPEGGLLHVSARPAGERVEIAVADTGIGIRAELQHRIFEPFFTTKASRGAGLGLAVTYGIVARNGGTLRVQSAPGQGTTITISLPVAPERAIPDLPGPSAPAIAAATRPGRARVLVVDDDPRLAQLLATMVQRHGHDTVVAAGGEEALAIAEREQFDLVLSDIGMPGLNGLQLAQTLRERQPGLPIGLVTGWGESITEHEWRAVGASALLPKPFGLAEVFALLAQLLPGESAANPAAPSAANGRSTSATDRQGAPATP